MMIHPDRGKKSFMPKRGRLEKNEKKRAATILERLEKEIPEPETALHHKTPFQLLIATILSAQCTDVRVNQVTPFLFDRFPTPLEFVKAEPKVIEALIRSTGFFKNKTKNIITCSEKLLAEFGGQVPETMDELITLPGVGRKTANVVLGSAFGQQTVVVDTHVRRVANRLGMTQSSDPERIETDLKHLFQKNKWTTGAHRLLLHGRHVCKARKPNCPVCILSDLCPEKAVA